MQILIPMGGAGSRFTAAGSDRPKSFIEFYGKTMIENVVENLGYRNHYTLVAQRAHYDDYRFVFDQIAQKVTDLRVVLLDGITGGAADPSNISLPYRSHP